MVIFFAFWFSLDLVQSSGLWRILDGQTKRRCVSHQQQTSNAGGIYKAGVLSWLYYTIHTVHMYHMYYHRCVISLYCTVYYHYFAMCTIMTVLCVLSILNDICVLSPVSHTERKGGDASDIQELSENGSFKGDGRKGGER